MSVFKKEKQNKPLNLKRYTFKGEKVEAVGKCRSSPPEVFLGKGVLKICSLQENTRAEV